MDGKAEQHSRESDTGDGDGPEAQLCEPLVVLLPQTIGISGPHGGSCSRGA